MVKSQSTNSKLIGAVAVLIVAAGGIYYWKKFKRPGTGGAFIPFSSSLRSNKCPVSFCDRPTDVMSFTSMSSCRQQFGRSLAAGSRSTLEILKEFRGQTYFSNYVISPHISLVLNCML